MTAPEKIWANPYYGPQPNQTSGIWKLENPNGIGTEYTRSDMIPNAAYVAGLEAAASAGRELAGYASYSEIVGAIGHNRQQIRDWCDKVFEAGHVVDAALSARPDAPDARVVKERDLVRWLRKAENFELNILADEIRAIIGENGK